MHKLKESFKEVISSILPMTVLILILSMILAPFDTEMMVSFLGGAVMMIIGMALFLFGADFSMMEVGTRVGSFLVRKRSLAILVIVGFVVGMFITIAEPDVQVLAEQVEGVSQGAVGKTMLTAIVGVGVGIFLVLALLRIIFQIRLINLLMAGYALIFLLSAFASPEFIPVAFDSGGVTTGPLTVPFILALGTGITSAIRSNKDGNDSFGMVGLASLGPVLAVMILGGGVPMNLLALLFEDFGQTAFEVLMALTPIVAIFLVLQFIGLRLKKKTFLNIMKGFVISYVGLVLFMQGVHIAFVPVGTHFGEIIGAMENNWLLIPIGFVMGFLVAFAEPAVHVMIKQVEELTSGTIKSTIMLIAISIGVATAVMLAMMRLVLGVSLWYFLVPGYIIVFVLARFVDPTFIAMAFDNGGVATGPMCSTFILALSVAVAGVIPGRDPLLDGFGIVSLIALAPIITTMLLSFIYKRKARNEKNKQEQLDIDMQQV